MSLPPLRLLLVLLAACAGGSHLDRLDDATSLRAADPVAFRLAIAPLQVTAGVDLNAPGVTLTAASIRAQLLSDLQHLRAASAVDAVDDGLAAATAAQADLLLLPRLSAMQLSYRGATSDGLLSSLLWITTWIGGLFIADSDYEARLQIDWEVVNPHNGQTIGNLAGSSRTFCLGFLDRHDFLSLGTLQSLLVPPVLTADDATTTAQALAAAAIGNSAGELTRFLKLGLGGEERELLGELRLDSPKNGESVAGPLILRGAVLANDMIAELVIVHDGVPVSQQDAAALPPRSRQQVGARTYRVPLPETALSLRDGANWIGIDYVAGGRRSSRTVVLYGRQGGRS